MNKDGIQLNDHRPHGDAQEWAGVAENDRGLNYWVLCPLPASSMNRLRGLVSIAGLHGGPHDPPAWIGGHGTFP